MFDAKTAIALLEQKRIADEEQRMSGPKALAAGAQLGLNRIIQKSDQTGDRQFSLWQNELKNYTLSKLDGTPLDTSEQNLVYKYIAQNNDMPPGIQLKPKPTADASRSMGSIDLTKYLIDPKQSDLQGEALLNNVQPKYKQLLQGIIDYKTKPSDIASTRGEAANLYALASNIKGEPIDATVYNQKYKTAQDFMPNGRSGKNITSLNTAIGHINSLLEASKKLDNAKLKKYNSIANWFKNETGNPDIARFRTAENAVAGEMATVFKGTAGTDQEIESWKTTMDAAQSAEQARAVAEQMIDLIKSRVDVIGEQWTSLMGDKPLNIVYDKSKKILIKYGYDGTMNKIGAPSYITDFATEAEAEAANLPKGTKITIGGRPAEVQ